MNAGATFAKAIGVNSRQPMGYDLKRRPHQKLQDVLAEAVEDGRLTCYLWDVREMDTYQAVMAATAAMIGRSEFNSIIRAAMGVSRSVSTGRLCPVAANRLKARKPYELCLLLGRIAAECPTLCTAEVDEWLRSHKDEL